MKHTPGPWFYHKEIKPRYDSFTGEKIESVTNWIKYDSGEYSNLAIICTKDIEANAALIAAAPEMLAALESIFDGETPLPQEMIYRVETAIKKAKGE
jgi:hypothetical protein